jgi:hypothetical protein
VLFFIGLLANIITFIVFWHQRDGGKQAKKTVEKYAKSLLFISLGDFVCHSLWVTIYVSLLITELPNIMFLRY